MRKIILGLTAMAALAGPMAIANSAVADTAENDWPVGGTISLDVGNVSYDGIGPDDCTYAPVTISIDVPDDYAYANFEYTSTYDGPTDLADQIDGGDSWSGTYDHEFIVCPEYDSPGSYMGYLDVTFYDFDGNAITTTYTQDAFHVYGAGHTASLSTYKTKSGTHGWTVHSTSRRDGSVWRNHLVKFQRKYSGAWHTIASKNTNTNGVANFATTPPAGTSKPYRVVLTAGTGTSAKVSPTYWLHRR
jgi:hypothetical protein